MFHFWMMGVSRRWEWKIIFYYQWVNRVRKSKLALDDEANPPPGVGVSYPPTVIIISGSEQKFSWNSQMMQFSVLDCTGPNHVFMQGCWKDARCLCGELKVRPLFVRMKEDAIILSSRHMSRIRKFTKRQKHKHTIPRYSFACDHVHCPGNKCLKWAPNSSSCWRLCWGRK